jgi:hypothetical protein
MMILERLDHRDYSTASRDASQATPTHPRAHGARVRSDPWTRHETFMVALGIDTLDSDELHNEGMVCLERL